MNKNFYAGQFAGLLLVLGLVTAPQAVAATKVTAIEGSMGTTQETCLQGLTTSVGDGENCMYDGGPSSVASAAPFGEVTGSYQHIAYYDSLATPAAFQTTDVGLARTLYVPTVGDGKIAQKITGSVTIDDNGNGFGADDLISFTLTLTSPGSGAIVRSYGSSVVDKYDSMTQVLAPTAASSATANGSGGFDYVIGSEGFPIHPHLQPGWSLPRITVWLCGLRSLVQYPVSGARLLERHELGRNRQPGEQLRRQDCRHGDQSRMHRLEVCNGS